MTDYDAVVIGAGLGGLSCAAILAQSGMKVAVCENTGWVGGCCSSMELEGYRFDIGASVVELSWIIDEFFEAAGRKTSDYIDFIPVDPIYGFVTEDGKRSPTRWTRTPPARCSPASRARTPKLGTGSRRWAPS
jgi:phytoene dehydrogenase-like protein